MVKLHILSILLFLSNSFAQHNLNLIFDDIKCSADTKDYIKFFTCSIDKSPEFPVLNVDFQMKKEVQEFRVNFAVYASTRTKKKFTAFKVEGVNYCDLQEKETVIAPIAKTLYDMIKRAGTLPGRCPIAADFHYSFNNISVNQDLLPSYFPKVNVKIVLSYHNKKQRFFTITTLGRVTNNKMEGKNRRRS
ncbi:uncharacterized protein LOC129919326 [Episyrphus balteatus]|uniref:uncharacterized protein LOC129919326 n=1 Tax=Episyrphus balteatus TaxID=286459 RepID=UPI0024851868|nr:uncharacterized protein LOC129919326 [Episyrphus balteatus]